MEMDEWELDWHIGWEAQYKMADMAVQGEEPAQEHVALVQVQLQVEIE